MSRKSKSSRSWLQEHFSDPYVKQAKEAGYRSRAVYKLLELQKKDQLFKPGMTVIDLGAAPGGWSQAVIKLIQPKGRLIALDILPIEPIVGVECLQGDFTEETTMSLLRSKVAAGSVDWVVSDLAPNMSGNACIDMPRIFMLAEFALDFSLTILNKKGGLLIKIFQGEGFDAFFSTVKKHFHSVIIRKPNASRGRSAECYLLARKLK